MDHIPTPEHPFRIIRVPWLSESPTFNVNHESGAFRDFPARHGRKLERLLEADFENKDSAETAAFLQEWLFFGLLASIFQVCGNPFDKGEFVRYTSKLVRRQRKRPFVTTRPLGQRLQQWYDKEKYQPVAVKMDHEDKIRHNYTIVAEVIEAFNQHLEAALNTSAATTLRSCLPGEVELSITILLATVQYFHMVIYDPPKRLKVPQCPWLSSRMVEEGWCTGQVTKLWRRHDNVLTMYYFKLLGPPMAIKDHSLCTQKRCAANDVLEDVYVTPHYPREMSFLHAQVPRMFTKRMSCRCGGFIGPDIDKLDAIIERGDIPLISARCARILPNGKWDESLDLQVVACEPDTPYIAISHVWSDGLGNIKENTLPICQLKGLRTKLQHMITANPEYFEDFFPEGVYMRAARHLDRLYFWMDTLCVPVSNHETRKMAIQDMRAVFETATAVLVKDAELNSQADRYAPVEELTARVAVSPWCGRLWTLQEAAVNDKVFIQLLHDDIAPLDELQEPTRSVVLLTDELLEAESSETPESGLMTRFIEDKEPQKQIDVDAKFFACPSTILSMNVLPPSLISNPIARQTKAELFLQILTEVQSRETSNSSDEAICLAALLNEDVSQVLNEDDESRRWIAFLSVIEDVISPKILFANLARMNATGYRWAPRTFLKSVEGSELSRVVDTAGPCHGMPRMQMGVDSDSDSASDPPRRRAPSVRIGDLGLVVSYPGFAFHPLLKSLPPEFTFMEEHGKTRYRCITEYAHQQFQGYFGGSPLLPEGSWEKVVPGPSSQVSIVLEEGFSEACAFVRGALLTDCCNKFGIMYGTFICLVLVLRTSRRHSLPNGDQTEKGDMTGRGGHSGGELDMDVDVKYDAEQEWCVG